MDSDEEDEVSEPIPTVAGVVPIEEFVARNDRAAIVLQGIRARRDGFQVTARAYWRVAKQPLATWSGAAEYPELEGVGAGEFFDRFPSGYGRDDELDAGGELRRGFIRFGVQFDDLQISNVDCMAWTLDKRTPRPEAGMWPLGGRGASYGPGTYGWHDSTYWIWPLPTDDITFTCEWRAFGLLGAGTTHSAQPLVDAATRARAVWEHWTNVAMDPLKARRQPLV